ncbi:LysR family transcriptional regulator [uncultured Ruegeria sp.]|uniref:LysR family transcriptional regulator n=1 Tax=uncultured Ruegeria sp. TaxID=259304 RepID=UPI00262495CE|nr:LysR family transcriptional regulator [uncultured Ruegeria sp.]
MNIRFLEAFVWVSRLKSFRAAGEKLNVSQATISSRISTLEEEFQCRLFDRDRKEVTLSTQGARLLEKAETVLKAELDLNQSLKEGDDFVGRIRIGVIESIVHTWLGGFLESVAQTYPKLEIELTAEPTSHLHVLFAKGALDVIFQTDPIMDESVINSELPSLELCWICRSDSELAQGPVSLGDLARHQVITFTRGSKPHLSVLGLFEEAGLKPLQIHCVTSLAAISVLVRRGLGIATVPIKQLSNDGLTNDLSKIDTTSVPSPLALVASWHKETSTDIRRSLVELAKTASHSF